MWCVLAKYTQSFIQSGHGLLHWSNIIFYAEILFYLAFFILAGLTMWVLFRRHLFSRYYFNIPFEFSQLCPIYTQSILFFCYCFILHCQWTFSRLFSIPRTVKKSSDNALPHLSKHWCRLFFFPQCTGQLKCVPSNKGASLVWCTKYSLC